MAWRKSLSGAKEYGPLAERRWARCSVWGRLPLRRRRAQHPGELLVRGHARRQQVRRRDIPGLLRDLDLRPQDPREGLVVGREALDHRERLRGGLAVLDRGQLHEL